MEQYLFHQFRSIPNGNAVSKHYHIHEFWQVDFISAGSGVLQFKQQKQICKMSFSIGDTVIIPPGIEHCFSYDLQPSSWLSVKFTSTVQTFASAIFSNEVMLSHAAEIIAEALTPHFMSHSASMAIVNSALSVVIGRFVLEMQNQNSKTSEFVRQVKEFVYSRQGGDVRLSDVGEYMHCTGKHAALRFRQECGTSLKNFLDQTRADFAGKILCTSSKSLNEIAHQLEFRDVYAFSRFFKRITGKTLSEYRNSKPYSC